MSTLCKIRRNFQITIPAPIRKKSHLHVGDIVDLQVTDKGIIIKPQETIDRSQAWFWSKEWQEEERKVQKDFCKGKVKVSKNVDEFLRELDKK